MIYRSLLRSYCLGVHQLVLHGSSPALVSLLSSVFLVSDGLIQHFLAVFFFRIFACYVLSWAAATSNSLSDPIAVCKNVIVIHSGRVARFCRPFKWQE